MIPIRVRHPKLSDATPPLRAWYTIGELARLCGRPKKQVRKLLARNEIPLDWFGNRQIVYLSVLENSLPSLFLSVLSIESKIRGL